MGKCSTEKTNRMFFICMHFIADEIGSQKEIFETEPSQEDFCQLFFYAQALFEVHNLTHGEHFDEDFFGGCIQQLYEKLEEHISLEEIFDWFDYADDSISYFKKIHIEFLNGSSEQDSLMHYISAILSRFNSCAGTSAFSFAGIALASLMPDIFKYVGENYDYMLSLWDKSLDAAVATSVQSTNDFVVETFQEKTPQSSTTQPQQKNECVENKKTKAIKQNLLLITCIIALICSIVFNFYQYEKIQTVAKSNKDEVIYWAKNYTDEYNAHRESVNLLSEIKDEYFFYHNSAVIVSSPGGTKYHKYGCYHLGERFYIYNIENARAKGYTACADCEPDKILTSASNKIKKQRINSLVEEFPGKPAEPYKNN